jgi:peptidoglycan-associated lipoprotein
MFSTMRARNRDIQAAFRLGLTFIVAAALISAAGCSWFRRGKTEIMPITEPPETITPQNLPPKPVAQTPPADAQPEGPRPGALLPFPELKVIYFDYDKATIRPDQLAAMEQNLKYLLDHPNDKVLIEGHCDERGTNEYNFSLGNKRALAVKEYFVKNGIPEARIATLSKGEEEPVDPGHTEEAWAKNRRCEFKKMF